MQYWTLRITSYTLDESMTRLCVQIYGHAYIVIVYRYLCIYIYVLIYSCACVHIWIQYTASAPSTCIHLSTHKNVAMERTN